MKHVSLTPVIEAHIVHRMRRALVLILTITFCIATSFLLNL